MADAKEGEIKMKYRKSHCVAAVMSLFVASAASAQRFAPDGTGAAAPRVMLGITLPLGTSARARPTRLELSFDQAHVGQVDSPYAHPGTGSARSPVRLGLMLDGSHRFTFNGSPIRSMVQRNNLSTGAAIGIGAGVILVGLAVAFAASDKVPDDFLTGN